MTIFAGDSRRHAHFDTVRTANLLAFNRDRHRAAKNNQVVEYPDNTHPDGEDFIFRAVHEAPDPHRDADQIEQHRVDIGREITQSTYSSSTSPPFAVTLNLPLCGLISATKVGGAIYRASTVS